MKWNVEQRLSFLEARLFWEGRVNRKDLMTRFGISVPQASSDLQKYQKLAPKNIKYDKSGKFYYASSNFKPKIISPNPNDFFSQLHLISNGVFQKNASFLYTVPEFDVTPSPERYADMDTLRKILKAIKENKALEIEYQSMSQPDSVCRWIMPFAFGHDGFRWHIRAYCDINREFRDFIAGRILSIKRERPHEIDFSKDILWHWHVTFKIAPHPGFSEGQRKAIELDYGMENGIAYIKVRAAFVFYLKKRLGLDKGHEKKPPHEQHIVLINHREIEEAMAQLSLSKNQ